MNKSTLMVIMVNSFAAGVCFIAAIACMIAGNSVMAILNVFLVGFNVFLAYKNYNRITWS